MYANTPPPHPTHTHTSLYVSFSITSLRQCLGCINSCSLGSSTPPLQILASGRKKIVLRIMPDMLLYKVLCTPWELSRFRRSVLVPVSTTFLSDWSFSFLDFSTLAVTMAALVYWEYCCCSSHKMVDSLYLPLHKMASSSVSAILQCSAHVSHLQPFKYTCF